MRRRRSAGGVPVGGGRRGRKRKLQAEEEESLMELGGDVAEEGREVMRKLLKQLIEVSFTNTHYPFCLLLLSSLTPSFLPPSHPPARPSQNLHGFLCSQSLSDQEVSRYQLIQVLIRMTKAEVATAPTELPSLTGRQKKG